MRYSNPGLPDGSVTSIKLANDAVILSKLKEDRYTATNGGAVATTAGGATICTVTPSDVNEGDILLFYAACKHTKGATPGETSLAIIKASGTAAIDFGATTDVPEIRYIQNASVIDAWMLNAVAVVTVGGSISFELNGASLGSNGNVVAGAGALFLMILRAQ